MKTLVTTVMSRTGLLLAMQLAFAATANSADTAVALKDAFKGSFMIGVALNQKQFTEQDASGAGAGETAVQCHFS